MRIIICCFIVCVSVFAGSTSAQILSTSNQPSQVYSRSGSGIVAGPSVYGVFVGRTPCQEFLKALNMDENPACAKRKMGITLFQDPVTHKPTTYETRGMTKWSGKGKWQIVYGIPTDPHATVFQLILDASTSLFLLKGDDNVLFILDRNKNFLIGNAHYSYTMNRAKN